MISSIQSQLANLADVTDASFLQRYFKTGPGQYGEGDVFRGIRVPMLRKLAKEHRGLPLEQVTQLLSSTFHEDRLLALLILVGMFQRGDDGARGTIYRLYLVNRRYINNWDLVDLSAPDIVGGYLLDKDRQPLRELARSKVLWERRIAVLATFRFIREGDFPLSLEIGELLLQDREDLIHKAVGWMLREIGKRDLQTEEGFLQVHYRQMPRAMLRYAIERFPEERRLAYLKGTI